MVRSLLLFFVACVLSCGSSAATMGGGPDASVRADDGGAEASGDAAGTQDDGPAGPSCEGSSCTDVEGGAGGGPDGMTDARSEAGSDAGSGAGPDASGGMCGASSDCRAFSDYCGGCSCKALGASEPNPVCDAGTSSCLVDPCQGHSATCSSAHLCAIQ